MMVVAVGGSDKGKGLRTRHAPNLPEPDSILIDDIFALRLLRDPAVRKEVTFTLKACVASLIANVLMFMVLAFMALKPVYQEYYWTTGDGTVHPLVALSEPVVSEAERTRWLTGAITNAFSMDFTNYATRIRSSRDNFTKEGYAAFLEAMNSSGLVDSLLNYKYRLFAVPSAVAVQVLGGALPDEKREAWQYQLPMLLTYEAPDNKQITQNIMVEIVLVRVLESENPRGMAIARFQSH